MPRVTSRILSRTVLIAALVAVGCREAPAGLQEPQPALAVLGEDLVYAAPGVPEALRVTATDAVTRAPLRNVRVDWQLVSGTGALSRESSETDSYGVATTLLRATVTGTYRVTASTERLKGPVASFEVRVVEPPTVRTIQPQVVAAGGTVVVTGSGFGSDPRALAVYFDGFRGTTLSATDSEIRATAPACLPARDVQLRVGLGSVLSAPLAAATSGGSSDLLDIRPGQVRTFNGSAEFGCLRLPGHDADASYVLVVHNVAQTLTPPAEFELRALSPRAAAAAPETLPGAAVAEPFADAWERALRLDERRFAGSMPGEGIAAARAPLPQVGELREFSVVDRDRKFRKVSATTRAVTSRAIIYVDRDAESVLTPEDIAFYGQIFDDPIHATTVGTFGAPSDIDANDRVIILFTPRVNELTPANEASFVAGFFYGCDLLAKSRCSGSNQAEVFYSVVPDPTGRWGDRRTHATVRAAVPPVLAHEFQHMINFARRGFSSDVLWLSEALAHTAEEVVADALLARGDAGTAATFRTPNLQRVQRYLTATGSTSLISDESPGTLELRGGGWLLLRYLRAHYGGDDLLRRLTATSRSGIPSVTHETGRSWDALLTDFSVAVWADGAPQMRGPLDARHQIPGFDLRTALGPIPGSFPLSPALLGWRDIVLAGSVAPAAASYFSLVTPADGSGAPLHLVFSAARGAPFPAGTDVRVSLLRVR